MKSMLNALKPPVNGLLNGSGHQVPKLTEPPVRRQHWHERAIACGSQGTSKRLSDKENGNYHITDGTEPITH